MLIKFEIRMIKKEMVNLVSQMQRRWANIVIEIGQEYKKKTM